MLYITDPHTMGKYIQNGRKAMFEPYLIWKIFRNEFVINDDGKDLDGLHFLRGKNWIFGEFL